MSIMEKSKLKLKKKKIDFGNLETLDDDSHDSNILAIDGYDGSSEHIDISGTLNTDYKQVKREIKKQLPWTEKHRPSKLEDIVLDNNTLNKIRNIIDDNNIPNIIMSGDPGIGKTTTVKYMANALYGKNVPECVLELNASDDRGVNIVGEKITDFCKKSIPLSSKVKLKLIILDEADNITSKAQYLINKKMEEYHSTTRFAFTCNKSSDIIEAIQSKCIIFRYVRLSKLKVIDKLKIICGKENVNFTDDALNEISIITNGDLRAAINLLQMVHNGLVDITVDNVYKICDKPQPMVLRQIVIGCKKLEIKEVFDLMNNLKKNGYSNYDIITGLLNLIKLDNFDKSITEKDKIYIFKKVCDAALNVSKGLNSDLQLYSCISDIIDGYHKKNINI